MATDTFKRMVTTFLLISLAIYLALGFIGNMVVNYNVNDTFIQERFHYDDIYSTLNSSQETAENWRESFEKQNIFSVVAGIVVTGIFQITKQMVTFILIPFDVLALIFVDVLGIPSIVFNVIIFLIIVSAIFGIWSLLKKGD